MFATPETTVDKTVTVIDQFNGSAALTLGSASQPSLLAFETFRETRTLQMPAFGCASYPNTASILETGQTATAQVTTCGPARTGAQPTEFWLSAAGQSLILNAGLTTGACTVLAWLRQFAPFQDLPPRGSCRVVADYVNGTLRSATLHLPPANALLKVEALTTALDVYFSDPAFGGNKIGAPGPIAGALIDLAKVCTGASGGSCGAYENVTPAFSGNAVRSVLQVLTAAASQATVSGTTWYGNVAGIEKLAIDTFHAINNQLAFAP
jgi:hypothetical protein